MGAIVSAAPKGVKRLDMLTAWRERASDVRGRAIDCGHFLPEEAPPRDGRRAYGLPVARLTSGAGEATQTLRSPGYSASGTTM